MTVRERWGWLIRHHRRMYDYTQADLADLMSVSQAAVASWERGARTPTPELLVKLVRLLDINPNDLFWPSDDEEPEAEAEVMEVA